MIIMLGFIAEPREVIVRTVIREQLRLIMAPRWAHSTPVRVHRFRLPKNGNSLVPLGLFFLVRNPAHVIHVRSNCRAEFYEHQFFESSFFYCIFCFV